jgi:hypothetical protein
MVERAFGDSLRGSGLKCKEAKKPIYSPRRALAYMNRHSITCQIFIYVRESTVAMQEKGENIPVEEKRSQERVKAPPCTLGLLTFLKVIYPGGGAYH